MFPAVAARVLPIEVVRSGGDIGCVLDEEGSRSLDELLPVAAGTPHSSRTAGSKVPFRSEVRSSLDAVGGGYVECRWTVADGRVGGSEGRVVGAGEVGGGALTVAEVDGAADSGGGGEPAAVRAGDDLLELAWLSLERRWVCVYDRR